MTHHFSKKDHGRPYSATIQDTDLEGKVCIQDDKVYLCQNTWDGDIAHETFGYEYSWVWNPENRLSPQEGADSVENFKFLDEDGLSITKEKILEAAKTCPDARRVLKTLFPEAWKPKEDEYYHFEVKDGHTKISLANSDPIFVGNNFAHRGQEHKVLMVDKRKYKVIVDQDYSSQYAGIRLKKI